MESSEMHIFIQEQRETINAHTHQAGMRGWNVNLASNTSINIRLTKLMYKLYTFISMSEI